MKTRETERVELKQLQRKYIEKVKELGQVREVVGVGGYEDRNSSDLQPQRCQVRVSRRPLGGHICHIWQDPHCSGPSQPAGGGRGV